MKIKVNGKEKVLDKESVSVVELLKIARVEKPDMVSVQLNGEFVKKGEYENASIKDGDEVDFLYFMGGGSMKNLKFITKILHNRFVKEDVHGSLHMPIYDNVAFEFKTSEDIALAFQGKKLAHTYSRISNPTVENFEQKIKAVTDARGVIALSSGMAAISNIVLAVCSAGDNIVTSRHLFGNTFSLFDKTLKAWGLEARYTDLTDEACVDALVDEKTKIIFAETITNPQLEVADIKALSNVARRRDILLVVDTTLTPPCIFNSKENGVDIEVLSSTKYISGGASSVGGAIIDTGTFDWSKNSKLEDDVKKYGELAFLCKLRREVYRNLGACLSPHNAFLQSLGLETLTLRVGASCENALKVAEFLEKTKGVKNVNYPGLRSSKYYEIARKQFGNCPGSLLTFDLGPQSECFKFMDKLQFIKRSTNLNDNRTLIIHPASTIFCEFNEKQKQEMNVADSTIRLSIGIEDAQDLINDINSALDAVNLK